MSPIVSLALAAVAGFLTRHVFGPKLPKLPAPAPEPAPVTPLLPDGMQELLDLLLSLFQQRKQAEARQTLQALIEDTKEKK